MIIGKEVVTSMNIEQMIIEAIKKNELYKVLLGEEEYKMEVSQFIGANVPTDWPNIMRGGVYKVFNKHPDLHINERLENALEILLSKDVFEVYVAISVLFFQIISEENKISPFRIDRKKIIGNVRNVLVYNKTKMKSYKKWMGEYYKNGIWGEVERISNILMGDYGINIIN